MSAATGQFGEDIELLQRFAGVKQDRDFGPKTAAALVEKLALRTSSKTPTKIVCIDAGHGLGNKVRGIYDPGAVNRQNAIQEADIALKWALCLESKLKALGARTVMTRIDKKTECPVGERADKAKRAGASMFVSIHVNDDDSASANGTETLYMTDPSLANKLQADLIAGLGLRDRGVKFRSNLAVLRFSGPCALLELGFINHAPDLARICDNAAMDATCDRLAKTISEIL